jgi:hypothetical protein
MLKMLKSGRVDLICIYEDSLNIHAAKGNYSTDEFKAIFAISETKMYFAFSRSTENSIVNRFQKALESIDAERKTIVRKYHGIP